MVGKSARGPIPRRKITPAAREPAGSFPSASPKPTRIAVALRVTAEDETVAVLQERARLAVRQLQRVRAAPRHFEEAAEFAPLVAADRAGAKEIADIHGAAGAAVMHELLQA